MNVTALACAPLLFICGLIQAANFAEYYASPAGGGDVCSQASPGSIYSARDKVRTVNSGMTGDVVVYLRGGTYALDSAFVLRPGDSGNNGFSVVYTAFPGETPVLSGGRTITGWTLFDAAKHIYRASAGASLQTRQLYVNGVRAVRARGPQNPSGFARTATGFTTTDTSMQRWRNIPDIEIVSFKEWKAFRGGVASITGTDIVMKQPYWGLALVHSGYTPEGVTWVENAFELLDSPGEWYYDRGEGAVYYRPRAGEDLSTAEAVAPVLETLVRGEGTLDTPLHHVRFSGITFAYATWVKPCSDTGFPVVQSGTYMVASGWGLEKMAANLCFDASKSITFERNVFTHLGAAGLDFEHGSQYNEITGNRFTDISGNGIQIGGIQAGDRNPTDPRVICRGNRISNNLIEKAGAEYLSACGIIGYFVDSTLIEHNELFNLPYSGMSIGWSWNPDPTASRDNKIRYNLIHHYMQVLKDGGGIYTLGAQPGTEVGYNYLHHQGNEYGMLYPDEGSSYMHWHHNVTEAGTRWLHMWKSDIQFDTVEYNYHDNDVATLNGTNDVLRNNTLVTGGNWPPEALAIMDGAGLEAAYEDIRPVVSPKPPQLLLRIAFDETSGLTAPDSSVNDYDGVFTAGTWSTGRLGNGLELDGSHAVSMPGPAGPMPAFTVAFWLKPYSQSDWNQAIGGAWGQFIFHTTATGAVYCGIDVSSRFTPTELPAGTLTLNAWQHFAYTFSNGAAAFYKNGARLAQMTQMMPQDWTGFSVGSVHGIIDELRVYDQSVDSAMIAVLAQGRDSLWTDLEVEGRAFLPRLQSNTPFGPAADILYTVPGRQGKVPVRMGIYSVTGQLAALLVNEVQSPGNYSVVWNAGRFPAGLYICRLETAGKRLSKKLVLMR